MSGCKRFVVLARVYDPIGSWEQEPFFVNWDTKRPLTEAGSKTLARRLARENPQNEYYVASLVYHSRFDEFKGMPLEVA